MADLKYNNFKKSVGDNERKDLEDKIADMWKIIEDLRQKVLDERELLKKEKIENENLMEEQSKLRKQLSMFHLPHCPAYNNSPCPIHSSPSSRLPNLHHSQPDINTDFYTDLKSYEDLLKQLDSKSRMSHEDLFHNSTEMPSQTEYETRSFTQHLSNNWLSKQTYNPGVNYPHPGSATDAELTDYFEPLRQQNQAKNPLWQSTNGTEEECKNYQELGPHFVFKFGESQLTSPSKKFP